MTSPYYCLSSVSFVRKLQLKGLKTRVGRKIKISTRMKELVVNLTLLVGCWLKRWGSPSGILIKHICLLCIVQLRPSWYHLQLLGDRHRGQICWCPSRHRMRVHWQGRNRALGNRFQPRKVERWHCSLRPGIAHHTLTHCSLSTLHLLKAFITFSN